MRRGPVGPCRPSTGGDGPCTQCTHLLPQPLASSSMQSRVDLAHHSAAVLLWVLSVSQVSRPCAQEGRTKPSTYTTSVNMPNSPKRGPKAHIGLAMETGYVGP